MDMRIVSWNKEAVLLGDPYCVHIASPMQHYEGDEAEVSAAFQAAESVWQRYLEAKSGGPTDPRLVEALEGEVRPVPKSLALLLKRLRSY